MKSQPKTGSGSDFENFTGLLDRYADFVVEAKKMVFRSPTFETERLFARQSPTQLQNRLGRLHNDLAIMGEAMSAGEDLNDSPRLLWRYFQRTGLTPCSDIFDRITDGDVVEVYSPEQVHLWQNMAFFHWTSITLERVYLDTWYNISKRDMSQQQILAQQAIQIFSGIQRETVDPGIAWHLVEEVDSEMLLKFELRVKYLSPIFHHHQVAGLIAVSEAREPQ